MPEREEIMRMAWHRLKNDELYKITSVEMKQIFALTNVKWSCKCKSRLKDAIVVALSRNSQELRPKWNVSQEFGFKINGEMKDYINMTDADVDEFLKTHNIEDFATFIKKRTNG